MLRLDIAEWGLPPICNAIAHRANWNGPNLNDLFLIENALFLFKHDELLRILRDNGAAIINAARGELVVKESLKLTT